MPDTSRLESIWRYVTIISALVAAAVGIGQYRRGVSQSIRVLDWKQADMARTLINGMMTYEGLAIDDDARLEKAATSSSRQAGECTYPSG